MAVDFSHEWWTELKAALLMRVFEGQNTLAKNCLALDIPYATASLWTRHEEFKKALATLRHDAAEQLDATPFLRREQRLIALAKLAEQARDEWESRRYLIEQRPVPGGMLTNEKLNRDAAEIYRNSLADIAAELGQRRNKVDLSAPDSAPAVVIQQMVVPPELLGQYMQVGKDIPALPAGNSSDNESEAADNPFSGLEADETDGKDF